MNLERTLLRDAFWSCYYKRVVCTVGIRSDVLTYTVHAEVVGVQAAIGHLIKLRIQSKRRLPFSFTEMKYFIRLLVVVGFEECECFAVVFITAICKVWQFDFNWLEELDCWICTKPHNSRNWLATVWVLERTKWPIRTHSKFHCDASGFGDSSFWNDKFILINF